VLGSQSSARHVRLIVILEAGGKPSLPVARILYWNPVDFVVGNWAWQLRASALSIGTISERV
jgi:hypothetical protein